MASGHASASGMIEKTITNRIAETGVHLRFDKVALRFLEGVKAGVVQRLPRDQSIVFTVTAPIKLPAKTSATLQEQLLRLSTQRVGTTMNGNEIRARMVQIASSGMPVVTGFVHNPESKADLILDIAEMGLRER